MLEQHITKATIIRSPLMFLPIFGINRGTALFEFASAGDAKECLSLGNKIIDGENARPFIDQNGYPLYDWKHGAAFGIGALYLLWRLL